MKYLIQGNELNEVEHSLLTKCLFIIKGKISINDKYDAYIIHSASGATSVYVKGVESGKECILHTDHFRSIEDGERFDNELMMNLNWHFYLDEGCEFEIERSIYNDEPIADKSHDWYFQLEGSRIETKDVIFNDTFKITKTFNLK